MLIVKLNLLPENEFTNTQKQNTKLTNHYIISIYVY